MHDSDTAPRRVLVVNTVEDAADSDAGVYEGGDERFGGHSDFEDACNDDCDELEAIECTRWQFGALREAASLRAPSPLKLRRPSTRTRCSSACSTTTTSASIVSDDDDDAAVEARFRAVAPLRTPALRGRATSWSGTESATWPHVATSSPSPVLPRSPSPHGIRSSRMHRVATSLPSDLYKNGAPGSQSPHGCVSFTPRPYRSTWASQAHAVPTKTRSDLDRPAICDCDDVGGLDGLGGLDAVDEWQFRRRV